MQNRLFSLRKNIKLSLWACQNATEALVFLLGNIYIKFGSKLYRQNVGNPVGTNCTPLLLICFYFAMRETSVRSPTEEKRYDIFNNSG